MEVDTALAALAGVANHKDKSATKILIGDMAMTEDGNIVWEAKLDDLYECRVVRAEEPYQGVLTVAEGDKTLHTQDVALSYNAQFGPDVADVAEWQEICIGVIDA